MFSKIQYNPKKHLLFIVLLLCFSVKLLAQSFSFRPHETSQKIKASDIKSSGLSYSFRVTGPAWTLVNSSSFALDAKIKSSYGFVKFYIDHAYPTKMPTAYRYGISFEVTAYRGYPYAPTTLPVDTLEVSYNPDSLATYQDFTLSKYSGYHQMDIRILDIYDLNTSPISAVPLSTLTNLNFIVEGSILTQWYNIRYGTTKYYGADGAPYTNLKSGGTVITGSDCAEIKWNLPESTLGLSDPVPIEPANFELEWTYVDNYKKDIVSGALTELSASSLSYDFTNNSSRVWLDSNHFCIPLIYQKGYIVYRVRMVRPDLDNFQYPIYSPWNAPDKGNLSSLTAVDNYLKIDNAHKNDSVNWQYTVSFAENGKYKHVLSYFDGLLKNRQSITRFNGTPNKLIATEQVYDYEGRPAISILPTPVASSAFTYQPNLSLNALTALPYKAGDFDTILKTVCPGEVPPAPLHSNALANIYYSAANPDQAGMQKFVPDAGAYPFVQTIYSAGYDKRIDRQGGAGDSLQIGFGHDTYNDYVGADQRDLSSLFGVDIGWAPFYRKTVTTDPNGQTSMSIQDFKGRQIASAMIGRGPDPSKHALIPNDNVPDSSFKIDELIAGKPQSIDGHSKILNRDFYMDAQGDDSIKYVFDFTPMYVCPNNYLSVKAHYNYEIFDQCGVSKRYVENTIGKTGVVTTAAVVSDAAPMVAVYLNKGKHSLRKVLTVNEEDAYATVDSLMKDPPPCFKDEPYFIKKSVLKENFPCKVDSNRCDALKKQMMDELWPKKKYGQYSRETGTVVGTSNSIFTIYMVPRPHLPPVPFYRYQMCEGITFPSSVTKLGRTYTDLSTLPVDTFIYIFNDAIAEALLPLHPEYCKLLNCYDDDYKEKLESIPSAAIAVTNGYFDLDDIISKDPILPKLTSGPIYFTNPEDSLATYRGGHTGIDTVALMKAYCNCSDSIMAAECFTKIFKTPINTLTFENDRVKDAYYKALLTGYFSNRERFKGYLVAAATTCEPCATYRMTLVPEPVFTSVFTKDGEYDFSGTGFLGSSSSLSDMIKRLMGHDASSMVPDSIYAYGDSAKLKVDSVNLVVNKAKIDSMIVNFANCTPSANLAALADTLHAIALRVPVLFGKFTPEQVRYALLANSIALTDLCNPYMISYSYMEARSMPNNTACRSTLYYDDIKAFFNQKPIEHLVAATASGTSAIEPFTLNTANRLEYDIFNVLGGSPPYAKIYATRNADTSLYTLYIMRDVTTPTDTVKFYFEINKKSPDRAICKNILNHSSTPSLDLFEFTDIKCISESPATSLGSGYIVDLSFVADIQKTVASTSIENCQLLAWNNRIRMTQAANGLEECVPCTQMLTLYKEFADSMTAYGVKGIDHPLHPTMLVNFMNDKLHRIFDWDQYTRFIESCALADSLPITRYNGYASIAFATDATANTFISDVNSTQAVYLDYFLRYKTDSVHLLLDFRGLPLNKMLAVRNYIASYASSAKVNTPFNPTSASNFIGWIINYKGTPFDSTSLRATVSAMFDIDPGQEIDVWTGRKYVKYVRYPVYAKSGVNNTLIAAGIAATSNFLSTNHVAAYFINYRETTSDDEYSTTEKQAYLSHVFSFADKKTYEVLDYIKPESLDATIFPSRNPQYGSTTAVPDINNLYLAQVAHPGLTKATYMLTKAKDYFKLLSPYKESIVPASFPSTRTIEIISMPTEQLNLYHCGDQSYWYRYFGTGDTIFNIFFRMPKYIADADLDKYEFNNVVATSGKGNSRNLRIKLVKGSDIIYINAFTDFTVGQSQILHDALLTNAFGVEQPTADTILNCERSKLISAVRAGKEDYRLYLDSTRLALRKTFYEYVINNVGEKLYLGYIDQRFNYTLYYYDRAGNLIRTAPPAGVHKIEDRYLDLVDAMRNYPGAISYKVIAGHGKISQYQYNTLDKVVKQSTPDGGEVNYIYDELGRVIYSQNKKQAAKEAYTYTFYDAQGRVTETGEVDLFCGTMMYMYKEGYGTVDSFWQPCIYLWSKGTGGILGIPPHYSTQNPYIHNVFAYTEDQRQTYIRTKNRSDVVCTIYDTVAQNIGLIEGVNEQENLRKRVSCIKYFEKLPPTDKYYQNYTYATHYSYDIAGNVKTLLHDYPALQIQKQRYKTVDYDYDLASGKVNLLSYNRGWGDQYYQRYSYDDDNRITKVETSADGYIWKRDAEYQYYQHGPLARASIGDLRVQGIDFAYTIQGWLKAVNGDILNPAFEMGKDSMLHNVHAYDAAATAIDYFKGDYKPIGGTDVLHSSQRTQGLYNGNISSIATDLLPFGPLKSHFTYDQLNRIRYATYDSMSPIISGVSSLYPTPAYYSNYRYDPDGNITKLIRRANKAGADMIMDSMTYYYALSGSSNKLLNVTDSAENRYIDDVDKFTDKDEIRYRYDAIGNITKDLVSNQDSIEWNLYNKVVRTENKTAKNRMRFVYDGAGHRVAKYYSQLNANNTVNREKNEYFVHDAQGNILAVYKHEKKYDYEYIKPMKATIADASAWMRTTLGTTTYIEEVLARDFIRDGDFEAAITPYITQYGNSLPPKPAGLYLDLDKSLSELLIHNSAEWVDSLRQYGAEYGNPMVISAPIATAFVDQNYELSNHIMHTFMSTPDTLKRRQVLSAMGTTISNAAMSILYHTHQLLDLSIDSTMDVDALASNLVARVQDPALLAQSLSNSMIAGRDTTDFVPYFDYLTEPTTGILSDAFYTKTVPYLSQTAVGQYGDMGFVSMFFKDWSQSYNRLINLLGPIGLYKMEYYESPTAYLGAMASSLGAEILDSTLAAMPELSLESLHDRAYSVMGVSSVATLDAEVLQPFAELAKEQVLDYERFNLAEHHLYGSSRLGIKNYLDEQKMGRKTYRENIGGSVTIIRDSGSLFYRFPWHSGLLNDVIAKTEKIPYDHIDNSNYQLAHTLGQKQYEVTNHLGNVLSTISDNRYEKMLGTGSGPTLDTVKIFAPAITASYDYYPFGMLMPGRYLAADTITVSVNILREKYAPSKAYSSLSMPTGASGLGSAALSTTPEGSLQMEADTIEAGMERPINLVAGHRSELELKTEMLLGDPVRASVYELVMDSNQVLRKKEIASTIIGQEGNYLMDFVPSTDTVYLRVVYHATGYEGTTSESAGGGGAGTGPAGSGGKGYSKIIFTGGTTTEEVTFKSRYAKIVQNPTDYYRFGFNGQEKVNEIYGRGTHLDFGARYYDSRVGRFFSVDPKVIKFPSQSPYSGFNNNPIIFNDPTGESGEATIDKQAKTITITSKIVLYGSKADLLTAVMVASKTQKMWNDANGFVTIKGEKYAVKFKITGEYRNENQSFFSAYNTQHEILYNKDIKNNYFRVESSELESVTANPAEGSFFLGSNSAYISAEQNARNNGTTIPHEYGHALGLGHHPPYDGKLKRIMNTEVQMGPGVSDRKVTQADIDDLHLEDLKFKNGKANVGERTNFYYRKDGKSGLQIPSRQLNDSKNKDKEDSGSQPAAPSGGYRDFGGFKDK
jgi:RHS repeat-associated protein